jgi:putative ABC transport system permease protein
MRVLRRFFARLANPFLPKRGDREFFAEIESHLAMMREEFERRGMNPEQARRESLVKMGGVEQAREMHRQARSFVFFESLAQDARFALRMLRKTPGFTAVAVLTLALGIGANTAIFTVVNSVLLRPLPYPKPQQIVEMQLQMQSGGTNDSLSVPQFQFVRDHSRSFEAVAGFRPPPEMTLKSGNTIEWVSPLQVTDGFFRVLAVNPGMGREFTRDETVPGGSASVILSDGVWRTDFGADPQMIGRQIILNDRSYTVVGVMPRGFRFVEGPADVFLPLQLGTTLMDRGMNTSVLARIKDGEVLRQAQSEMAVVYEQFRKQRAENNGDTGVQLVGYQDYLVSDIKPSLLMLFGAVGLLLLVACANVASLLMARANARQTEVSIRLALGATTGRLLQQLLTEGLLLALLGAAVGMIAAKTGLQLLTVSIPFNLPIGVSFALDATVLVFTSALALAVTVAFAAISFRQARKVDLNSSLKEGARGGGGYSRHRAGKVLVVCEVAFATTLLIGAGLLIKSLYQLRSQNIGFDPQEVITMTTPFRATNTAPRAALWSLQQQMLERVRAIPGVLSAAVVTVPPLIGRSNLPAQREGHPENSIGGMEIRAVSDDYFQTLRIPVLQGRSFSSVDNQGSAPVVLISETVARRWWNGTNPIGDRVVIGMMNGKLYTAAAQPVEVVGIVGDVKARTIASPAPPMIYVPVSQQVNDGGNPPAGWVIRTQKKANIETSLRAVVADVNPEQRIILLMTMKHAIDLQVAGPNFDAQLMGVFAGLGLVLTAIGIYGVISFHVVQRAREIGIRMALGATRPEVLRLVVGDGMYLASAGMAIGILAALVAMRFLASLLFQVNPTDIATYLAVVAALGGVALLACYIPARRAMRVDPMVALRHE